MENWSSSFMAVPVARSGDTACMSELTEAACHATVGAVGLAQFEGETAVLDFWPRTRKSRSPPCRKQRDKDGAPARFLHFCYWVSFMANWRSGWVISPQSFWRSA